MIYFSFFSNVSRKDAAAPNIPLISDGRINVFVLSEAVNFPIASTCLFAISKSIAGFPFSAIAFANNSVCFASAFALTSIAYASASASNLTASASF